MYDCLFFSRITFGFQGFVAGKVAWDLKDLAWPELPGIADLVTVGTIDQRPEGGIIVYFSTRSDLREVFTATDRIIEDLLLNGIFCRFDPCGSLSGPFSRKTFLFTQPRLCFCSFTHQTLFLDTGSFCCNPLPLLLLFANLQAKQFVPEKRTLLQSQQIEHICGLFVSLHMQHGFAVLIGLQ